MSQSATADLTSFRAATEALFTALKEIDDEMFGAEINLLAAILRGSVGELLAGPNARRVSDVDFALNDLASAVSNLAGEEQEMVQGDLDRVVAQLGELRSSYSLPAELRETMRAFQQKLKVRITAIERDTYREPGTPSTPLPHEPRELRAEAQTIQSALRRAGYDTPMLDQLIDDTDSMRLRQIADLMDELDVIIGT
jgi:hypothetical protein